MTRNVKTRRASWKGNFRMAAWQEDINSKVPERRVATSEWIPGSEKWRGCRMDSDWGFASRISWDCLLKSIHFCFNLFLILSKYQKVQFRFWESHFLSMCLHLLKDIHQLEPKWFFVEVMFQQPEVECWVLCKVLLKVLTFFKDQRFSNLDLTGFLIFTHKNWVLPLSNNLNWTAVCFAE